MADDPRGQDRLKANEERIDRAIAEQIQAQDGQAAPSDAVRGGHTEAAPRTFLERIPEAGEDNLQGDRGASIGAAPGPPSGVTPPVDRTSEEGPVTAAAPSSSSGPATATAPGPPSGAEPQADDEQTDDVMDTQGHEETATNDVDMHFVGSVETA